MPHPFVASTSYLGLPENRWQKVYQRLVFFYELVRFALLIVMAAIVLDFYAFSLFRIEGISMLPSFKNGQYVLVNKLQHDYNRGDVLVVRFPVDPQNKKLIKRVVGLPEEKVTIREGRIFVDNRELEESYLDLSLTQPDSEWLLKADELFLLGDNRGNSSDSRFWGLVPINKVIGKVEATIGGGSLFGWVEQPTY